MSSNFNTRPLILFTGAGIYIALTLFGFRALLGGDIIKFAFVLCMPLVLMFGTMRQFWPGVLLGCLSLWTLGNFKLPFMGSIGVGGLVELLILGFLILDIAMRKTQVFIRWRGYYSLFLISMVLIAARILYDRPGMANLGSEVGGLASAMNYLLAFVAFGVAYYAAQFQKSWSFTFKVLILCSIGAYLFGDIWLRRGVYGSNSTEDGNLYGLSYTRSLYLLFTGMMVVSLSPRALRNFSSVAFAVVIVVLLGLAGVSSVRSTIFQTGAMAAMAGLIYRRFLTGMGVYFFAGTAAILFIISSVPFYQLPENIRRPLTMFYMEKHDETKGYGLKDEFRDALRRYAEDQIRKSPVVGKGWGFDLNELLKEMTQTRESIEGGQLSMTGSFHNAFLTLAVNNGIPTAFICLSAFGFAGLSLLRYAKTETDPILKQSIAFMLVYASSMAVMSWVNGGSGELRCLAVALGLASAFRDMAERDAKREKSHIKSPGEPTELSPISFQS